jgi:hypothetical protein
MAFSVKKIAQTFIWATSVIFKSMPKANTRPMGENSSNRVALAEMHMIPLDLLTSANVVFRDKGRQQGE